MNPLKLLWSFFGRIGRLASIGGTLLTIALLVAGIFAFVYFGDGRPKPAPGEPPDPLIVSIFVAAFILLFWAKFALAAKRFHDLGNSGWFSVALIVPVLGLIALLYL